MMREFPEADWKVLRELREPALERFCERILGEVREISGATTASFHERYLRVFRLIETRDREIAGAFDAPRRSQALFQLARMVALGLFEPEDVARFSPTTRELIAKLTGRDDRA